MCTITVISLGHGAFRVGCNRDESRRRARAMPPSVHQVSDLQSAMIPGDEQRSFHSGPIRVATQAILPIDPEGGGTWLAVNDAGVVFALLNRKRSYGPYAIRALHMVSRGLIIPALLHGRSTQDAKAVANNLPFHQFMPFRLLVVDVRNWFVLCSDEAGLTLEQGSHDHFPMMLASSGLGDEVVDQPRRALFDEWTQQKGWDADRQDRFHAHQWPDRQHVSVCMSRAEAETVSYASIVVTPKDCMMQYHDGAPGLPGEDATVALPRTVAMTIPDASMRTNCPSGLRE